MFWFSLKFLTRLLLCADCWGRFVSHVILFKVSCTGKPSSPGEICVFRVVISRRFWQPELVIGKQSITIVIVIVIIIPIFYVQGIKKNNEIKIFLWFSEYIAATFLSISEITLI